jgi:hypothetical protein
MSRSWSTGSTTQWRRVRARVLSLNQERNGGRCTLGLRGCTGQADTVHHIYGKAITGDDPRFLAAVCQACNLRVGDPQQSNPQPKRVSRW